MSERPPAAAFDVGAWLAKSLASPSPALMQHTELWDNGFLVRLYDGPTTPGRSDFHINEVPELFYQLSGTLELRVLDDGVFVDHTIGEGEIYSLPALVPHRNQRGPGSRGLVVHVTRTPGQRDGIVWYCEGCEARGEVRELHRMSFEVGTLVEDLRTHIRAFLADEQLRTCDACGWVMPETQGSM